MEEKPLSACNLARTAYKFAYGYDLELTSAIDRVFKLFQDVERSLKPLVEAHQPAGADFQGCVELKFSDEADNNLTTENLYLRVDRL